MCGKAVESTLKIIISYARLGCGGRAHGKLRYGRAEAGGNNSVVFALRGLLTYFAVGWWADRRVH